MWAVLVTLLVANAIQSIASVFWTAAPLSLWGELVFVVLALGVLNAGLLTIVATVYSVPLRTAFCIDDDPAQRSLFRRVGGRITTAQTMALCAGLNAVAAITSWYGTPPDRVPPIIQAVFNSLIVLAAVPSSKWLLGDRKAYCSPAPLLGGALLVASVAVSLAPALMSPEGAAAQFTGSGAGIWSVYYALIMAPQALALTGGQYFQVRAGALTPGASDRDRRLILARMLFWNQWAVLAMLVATWWVDILPWFGSSSTVGEMVDGLAFTVSCSVVGAFAGIGPSTNSSSTGGSSAGSACPPWTPLWVALFLLSYVIYLIAQAAVARESAVFNTALLLLSSCTVSIFWLIPGVNPAAADTPTWSVLVALTLSVSGVAIWKRWELAAGPVPEQFNLRSIREDLDADADAGRDADAYALLDKRSRSSSGGSQR